MLHQYQLGGYNIVLDTCSGSIHVVDEVAYDAIALFEDHTPEDITAALLGKYAGRPDVTAEELRQGSGTFTPSEFVRRVTGVDNVCERAALAGGGETLIIKKTARDGVTVAAAVEKYEVRFNG